MSKSNISPGTISGEELDTLRKEIRKYWRALGMLQLRMQSEHGAGGGLDITIIQEECRKTAAGLESIAKRNLSDSSK